MDSLASFNLKLGSLERDVSGATHRARLARLGVLSRADINAAVRADLGDMSMSGWSRGNPHEIAGASRVISDHEVEMLPGRRAGGPMRVLEDGRNQGNARGFAGPGIGRTGETARTQSGKVRKVRSRASRQWNGTTKPKHTWTEATERLQREMPKRYEAELVRILGTYFRRG